MYCEFAKQLDEAQMGRITALEQEVGLTIVAFSCHEMDPEREKKLRALTEELGPLLQAEPADPDEAQLSRIREAEDDLGLCLVAVEC
jgi:hypothetical protein